MQFLTVEKLNKLQREVGKAVYREVRDIACFKLHEGDCPGAERPDFCDEGWADFQVGDTWGGYDVIAWFRARVPIPEGWHDQRLYLRFLVGPRDGGGSTAETMLYVNGTPLQAIDVWHSEAWLPPEHLQADTLAVALKAWSGVLELPPLRRFKVAQLIRIDAAAEHFYHLSNTLLQAIVELDENDLRRVRLLQALDEAYGCIHFVQPKSERFYRSLQQAGEHLAQRLEALGALEELKPRVYGIGHAHIDMAWLWRLGHSREKAARTFTTALHLMRQYPEYRFMHSSPQLYKFLQADYPALFERVKERVHGCQWEITGGMWIEADVNIPSGESLVRQFLLGKEYIRREFGADSRLLWLPDVFGFSWSLPQIARKSGMKYFLTSKMSWSQFNRIPYDTFRWRGIDGTELLTHFVTAQEYDEEKAKLSRIHTYNAGFYPIEVKSLWHNYRQKDVNDELLLLFGRGDGGGGPTKEMLESARVLRNLPGFPYAGQEKAEPFFARLEQRLNGKLLPVWDGELYLEYHRGTYTSQAFNKRANRKAEVLYHTAEWLSALADIVRAEDEYPAGRLREGWEMLLLNQFHDIVTGSSIRQVYEDSYQEYVHIEEIGREALTQARNRLLAGIHADTDSVVVFNPLAWQRDGLVALPYTPALAGKTILAEGGRPASTQVIVASWGAGVLGSGGAGVQGCRGAEVQGSGDDSHDRPVLSQQVTTAGETFLDVTGMARPIEEQQMLLLHVQNVPALGYATFPLVDTTTVPDPDKLIVTARRLENRYYRAELNERGQMVSLWDRQRQREVLAEDGRGNVLQAFQDKPLHFDAWDIDIYYQEKMEEIDDLIEAAVEETGPLRGVLRLRWRCYDSVISQHLTIYRHSPRIDFRTEIDWQEQDLLLKVAFPVAIRASQASYDIQFGTIERPTHWNTSWDYARFEVVGHKWADLSEGDYGVALLNDCKYGYDVKDNVLRLTLIKSATWPDAQADRGYHRFTYSLLPHGGDWRAGDVVAQGYDLNVPLLAQAITAHPEGKLPGRYQFAAADTHHVIVETVKKAEADDAWIVRVYERQQRRNPAITITFGQPLVRAEACNLIEEEEADPSLHYAGRHLTFALKPYEIKSFKVWFQSL